MRKFPLRKLLIFAWVIVNLTALGMIGATYLVAWRSGMMNSISRQDIETLAHSASKEQLSKFVLDSDRADRGLVQAIFSILFHWLAVTIWNVFFAVCYFCCPKQKVDSK